MTLTCGHTPDPSLAGRRRNPDECVRCWAWANKPIYRGEPAPPPARACIHLGEALPNQPGVPCGQRVRDCDVFGVCTVGPCSDPTRAHCLDVQGRPACPEYVAKDT